MHRLAFALLVTSAASCSTFADPPLPADQRFLFEVEYVNYAWGFSWHGTVIDRTGVVARYDLGDGEPWPHSDKETVTEAQLLQKYNRGREVVGQVDRGDLLDAFGLVGTAARGELEGPLDRCRDAGGLSFRAFQYDPVTESYHPVLLRTEGDFAWRNRAAAATTLYRWLAEVTKTSADGGCAP